MNGENFEELVRNIIVNLQATQDEKIKKIAELSDARFNDCMKKLQMQQMENERLQNEIAVIKSKSEGLK